MDVEADRIIHALHGADTLLLNEYERDLLIRRSGVSWERIIEPVDAAVVTSGPGGVAVETAGGITAVPAVTADAVDPNGAGDAFLAGYAFGRYRELPPLWCARLGATAAAFTVEAAGTQGHRFTLDEFHTRLIRYFGPEAEKLL
jgi:adenosine kinase